MTSRIITARAAIIALAYFVLVTGAAAQEHPEHPKGKEHPEHPAERAKAGLSKEDLSDAITAYVKREMEQGGGVFKVEDPDEKTTLFLTLSRVHKERLSQ